MTNRSNKPSPNLSNEQFEEWKQHPVTQQYFKALFNQAGIRRTIAAQGGCKQASSYETGEAYTRIMVQAEVYEACASPTYEDLTIEEDEIDQ